MSFTLGREDRGTGQCPRCKGTALHHNTEDVVDVFGVPFLRKYFSATVCTECRGVSFVPAPQVVRDRMGKTPGVAWRIGASYGMIALLGVAVWLAILWQSHVGRQHLADPVFGDVWTVRAPRWPGTTFENSLEHGVVRVDNVTETTVGVSACKLTSDDRTSAQDACTTFALPAGEVRRVDLEAMFDDDTIESVDSYRGSRVFDIVVFSVLGAIYVAWGLLCWRWKKRVALAE